MTAVAPSCPNGSRLVAGRGCVVERARTGETWQAPAPLLPADPLVARDRYSKGVAFFYAGNYQGALLEFEGAYAAMAAPTVLFNIGTCLEKLDRLDEAIDVLERFLETSPTGTRAAEARARVEQLRNRFGP